MGGLVGLLGPAIPAIAKHLGVEDTELGWAFSVRAGGYIIGSLITSRLPERCVPGYMYVSTTVAGRIPNIDRSNPQL